MNDSSPPLGAFSISLAVKDLAASAAFYQKLGFETAGGDPSEHWLMLRNGTTVIGLFEGMFDKNMLTFNPRWTANAEAAPDDPDIRVLLERFKAAGIEPLLQHDETGSGPAHFVIEDPDGNQLFFDQHV